MRVYFFVRSSSFSPKKGGDVATYFTSSWLGLEVIQVSTEPFPATSNGFAPSSPSRPLFALEGIGGSGKSHIGQLLSLTLQLQGFHVLHHKIAGLGNSPRVQTLKRIMWHRHDLMRRGAESIKQQQDRQRERIFRLAMRQQVKEMGLRKDEQADFLILDRTPLMIWVFAVSNDPNNPYLDEIREEVLTYTRCLNLTRVFLFDLAPETAYARMIIRYCVGQPDMRARVMDACAVIGADKASRDRIWHEVATLASKEGNLRPQAFESWDLIPIEVTRRERERHKEILQMCGEQFGLRYTVVNAEQPIKEVVDNIQSSIQNAISRS